MLKYFDLFVLCVSTDKSASLSRCIEAELRGFDIKSFFELRLSIMSQIK